MGMDGVELVMAWEEAFGISIPDDEASRLITPRHVIDFITSVLEGRTSNGRDRAWTRDEVRELVRQTIIEQIGVKEFSDDDEFVRDLGVD